MELTLLGTVAVAAFLVGGAIVMLVVAFRRTIELRGALIQALRRIEKLEAALVAGRPLDVAIAASPADAVASLAASAPAHLLLSAPPTIDEIAADAEADDRIDPPHLGVIMFGAGLAAFSALAAAYVQALSHGAGIFLAIAIGALTLAAAEWRRSADSDQPTPAAWWANQAALTALFGIGIIFAAILYGRWGLGALHAHASVFAMAALALLAAALSLRYGPMLVAASLLCAALAPSLSPIQADGAWGQYAFLFVYAAAMMLLARRNGVWAWAWCASAIAFFWGVNAAIIGGSDFNLGAAGLYLALLAALAFFYAWPAATSVTYPHFWRARWSEPLLLGHLLAAASSAALAALVLAHPAPTSFTGAAIAALVGFGVAASALRPGLWLAGPITAATAAATLLFWPPLSGGVADAPNLLILAAALALMFSLGGWAAMAQTKDARPGAALAALAPVLIFAAVFWRIADFGGPETWAAAGLAIAALNAISFTQLRRTRPDAASPFAAGAALAFAAALTAITPAPFQPLAIAASLPLLALAERWRPEAGLRFAAGVLCVLLFARLFLPQIFIVSASPPFLLALLFLPSAAAAMIASLIFGRGHAARDLDASRAAFALALVVAASCATLLARNAFTAGSIGAPYVSLAEAGLNSLIWLSLTLILAWRFGARPQTGLFALEFLAFAAAITHALIVTGILINPWWGYAPAPTPGLRFLNLIEFAFAGPAALFFIYAILRAHQGLAARAGSALGAALVLSFLTLVLELRRLFHGAAMATAPVAPSEAWVYSGAALGFGALLLALGVERNLRTLRYASLALALAALAKMAFADLSTFGGAARIIGFILIAAAAGGVVFFYRRFVLPAGPARPKTMADPKLVPPS